LEEWQMNALMDELKAGKELNKRLAIELFGARICLKDNDGNYQHGWFVIIVGEEGSPLPVTYVDENKKWKTAIWKETEEEAWDLLPNFSETYEEMKFIVDEMSLRGWKLHVSVDKTGSTAWFNLPDPTEQRHPLEIATDPKESETLPHAVCIAAIDVCDQYLKSI
jgi:hypothetical protein